MTLLDRCLEAARKGGRNPDAVSKSGLTRADFDQALNELTDLLRDDLEVSWRAFAKALDSSEGRLLYAAREAAPAPEPQDCVHKQDGEPVTKAERKIYERVRKHMRQHPGVDREHALIRVLEAEPDLYRDYLLESENRL
jgi:hypothetical protein